MIAKTTREKSQPDGGSLAETKLFEVHDELQDSRRRSKSADLRIRKIVRIYTMDSRNLKGLLYEQVARVGKALASQKRLECFRILAQGEVGQALANAVAVDIKLASAPEEH